jgi:hypothetical protein
MSLLGCVVDGLHKLRRRAHASNKMSSQSIMSLLHLVAHEIRRRAHGFVQKLQADFH